MITFLLFLLERAESAAVPAFLNADCTVLPSDHNRVVLSEIKFKMDCKTQLDFDSSLSGITISVTSSLDGTIFNETYKSYENISFTYYDDDKLYRKGFELSDLEVYSLGGHYLTVAIQQNKIAHVDGTESIAEMISSVSSAKCIHGIASIIPPISVLLVCLITKQVMIALPFAIWFGAWLIDHDWNPVTSFERVWDTYYIEAIADKDHAFILCFTIFLGGLVKVMEKTGGTQGIAKLIAERVQSSRSAAMGVFVVGLLIFFDDYANCLIAGYTFMPLMDQYMVSREKFSFIVDATAAPIASIAPLSSWVGFEIGLILEYYTKSDVWPKEDQPGEYITFLKTIPYRFYPIFMLWFMFYTLYFQYDFGPMLVAEKRAKLTGRTFRPERSKPGEDKTLKVHAAEMGKIEPRPLNAIVPVLTVIFVTLIGYLLLGVNSCRLQGLDYSAKNIFSEGNSLQALLWAVVVGNLVAFIMALCQHKTNAAGERVKLLSLSDLFSSFFEGVGVVCEPLFGILVFAWCLNAIVTDMSLGAYMISSIGKSLSIQPLPFLSFIISGLISLFVGSSWATMSVMFPLIVPLALEVSNNDQEATIAVMGTILAGSVCGDHCSPISDTTILSSMASGCDHNDHVGTQLPYATFVAFFSAIFGDLCVGYMGFQYPYIGIILGIGLMTTCTYFISTKVPTYHPDGKNINESDFKYSKLSEYAKDLSICNKEKKPEANNDEGEYL